MQTANVKARGLYTLPNPLDIPAGGMLVADNAVIDREGTIEQRRGFKRYGTALTAPKKLFDYQKTLLLHDNHSMKYDSDNAGTWLAYSGTFDPPTGATKIRALTANKNFYFATATGVQKLDSVTGTPAAAGMYKGLDGTGAVNAAGTGFMASNTQVAYRIVFGKTDANGNKILGAPSQRIIIANTSGVTKNIDLTFSLPSGMTTSHFYQIYRSGQSASSASEPNDELQLVVEANPTAGQIAALAVTYTDQTSDSLRGAFLYTNPSQQTIAQANDAPPLCRDMAFYKNMTLYANTLAKHRLNVTLISVGAPNGIQNGDTLTLSGIVYTGAATEDTTIPQFKVDTSGTPAQNIDSTAKSLIRCINRYSGNTTVYAYYLTGFADLPGQILIEERGIGGSAFVAISSRQTCWSPQIPSSGSSYTSSAQASKHRVYISKLQQPEAVPIAQYLEFGDAQKDILRIRALRDSVFVIKEDGLFRIIGETPSTLTQSLFDSTTELLNIESADNFNNKIAGYTTQGIAAVSDSGTEILSRPIELDLLSISTSNYPNFDAASFGCSYESDRKYMFFTVGATADTMAKQAFVYNSLTNTFTRWFWTRPDMTTVLAIAHALVHDKDNKLYVLSGDSTVPYLFQERKAYTNMDYADDDFAVQITGQAGLVLTVVDSTSAKVGYTLSQGSSGKASVITAIPDATHITVTDLLTWDYAAATVYKPISVAVKWAPIHGGNVTFLKHFVDVLINFRNATFNRLTMTYSTDMSGYDESSPVLPNTSAPWGGAPWGSGSWGGRDIFLQTIRTFAPINKSRGRWLNVGVAFSQALATFAIAGISVFYSPSSQRSKS